MFDLKQAGSSKTGDLDHDQLLHLKEWIGKFRDKYKKVGEVSNAFMKHEQTGLCFRLWMLKESLLGNECFRLRLWQRAALPLLLYFHEKSEGSNRIVIRSSPHEQKRSPPFMDSEFSLSKYNYLR